jgi:endoglucanase
VDPDYAAAAQAARWRVEGRTEDARAMTLLARRPTAIWLTLGDGVASRARSVTTRAQRRDRVAVIVAYFIPYRDCGSYSAGGARSAAGYRAFVRALARGIGPRRALVVVEPDAVPQGSSACLTRSQRAERAGLLRFAVRTLGATRRARVYLDAGNPGWIRPAARLVRPLRAAGIAAADGFALNVSNFFRTDRSVRYGLALSARLGGRHFVVDTGRNGRGPSRAGGKAPAWCNPPGRALGRNPTTSTGRARVDAYLWVKEPGMSDGACRPGAPPAGVWWPEYGLELVRNAG